MQQLGAILAPCFIDKHKKAHTLTLDGLYGLLTQHFKEELAMSSLTVMLPQVTIMDIAVRVLDGLYSLNDLHRASGGNPKHKPANFMRVETTKDLIAEIERCSDMSNGIKSIAYKTIRGGNSKNKGTWVCKELVYSYAMWINAKFHIAVIRTFDAVVNKQLASEQLNNLCYDLSLVTQSLTHAGRYLSVGGNQIKPALEKQIDLLMHEIQPQLTGFNDAKLIK